MHSMTAGENLDYIPSRIVNNFSNICKLAPEIKSLNVIYNICLVTRNGSPSGERKLTLFIF